MGLFSDVLTIFFISNDFQFSVKRTFILTAISTDNSPIFFPEEQNRSKGMVFGNLITLWWTIRAK